MDDHNKLRRKLTWRRKSSTERKHKKTRELRANGISVAKDNEALMGGQSEIELTGVQVEVRRSLR